MTPKTLKQLVEEEILMQLNDVKKEVFNLMKF